MKKRKTLILENCTIKDSIKSKGKYYTVSVKMTMQYNTERWTVYYIVWSWEKIINVPENK